MAQEGTDEDIEREDNRRGKSMDSPSPFEMAEANV